MRVILFTETFLPKFDGIVHVVCLLLDYLSEQGIETAIVAPRLDPNLTHYNDTQIISVPGFRNFLYPEHRVGITNIKTYQQIKAFAPDVAHFIHPVFVGLPGFLMAKRMDIPTVISFHLDFARICKRYHLGFLPPAINQLTRVVFNAADYRLAPSRLVQNNLHQLGIRDVKLWKRGVDLEVFHPRYRDSVIRDRISDGHPEEMLLLYVGRLAKEKQIEHIRPVLEQIPNTRLVIVGDGPYRGNLKSYFAGTKTMFLGHIQGEELSSVYASADVFVFPSALESFGLVVLEAMASGIPVVSSRVGGVRDVVEEGKTGYTFQSGDVATLIKHIGTLSANHNKMQKMGARARISVESLTWDRCMQEVVEIYTALIDAAKSI